MFSGEASLLEGNTPLFIGWVYESGVPILNTPARMEVDKGLPLLGLKKLMGGVKSL